MKEYLMKNSWYGKVDAEWADVPGMNCSRDVGAQPFVFLCTSKISSLATTDTLSNQSEIPIFIGNNHESNSMPLWVLVYNHATACHLQGIKMGKMDSNMLRRSHLLYLVAKTLINADPFSTSLAFLTTAIHNNQVCLLYELQVYKDFSIFCCILYDDLKDLTPPPSCKQDRVFLRQFLVNVCSLDQPRTAGAA